MTRITTPFDSSTTAADVLRDVSLRGKRAVITGGNSSIGIETARALAQAGAAVTLAVRRADVGEAVAAELRASTRNDAIEVTPLDLSDLASINRFCAAWKGPLHILVNNAAIKLRPKLARTPEGREIQFATNFLGHFALTHKLHHALTIANGARVVSVSSSANMLAPIIWDDLDFNFVPYDPIIAYGQSKTACILFAVAATDHWLADKVLINSVHPGEVLTQPERRNPTNKRHEKTPAQAAATSVLLSASPLLSGVTGRHFEDCNEATVVMKRSDDLRRGVAPYALDRSNAERLWRIAAEMI